MNIKVLKQLGFEHIEVNPESTAFQLPIIKSNRHLSSFKDEVERGIFGYQDPNAKKPKIILVVSTSKEIEKISLLKFNNIDSIQKRSSHYWLGEMIVTRCQNDVVKEWIKAVIKLYKEEKKVKK